MRVLFRYRTGAWHVAVLGWIGVWLCLGGSVAAWAEMAEQKEKTVIDLKDGTFIELAESVIFRVRKQPDISGGDTALWHVPAKEPQLPLVFENRQGEQWLLYYTKIEDDIYGKRYGEIYGEFRAIRVEDGEEQWVHPMWWKIALVSPIWVKPWIYFGHGTWLEKMEPDTGTITERYPARVQITSLQALPNETIEVHAEIWTPLGESQTSLRFQQGQFSPHVVAQGGNNLLASLDLYKRGDFVKIEFAQYLRKLYRIEKDLPSPESLLEWRDFDLMKTEKAYRQAYQRDWANPYFALYLAFSLYYQDREAEAEPYFQEALKRSAGFWEESFRSGGLCEGLGLTQWADAFYEQGMTQYFREAAAPPKDATLIEVLLFLLRAGGRQSSFLFANGQVDRALHIFEMRRQIVPYTEEDNWFSRKYVRWLRRMGQEEKAVLEEQRIGKVKHPFDFEDITPGSFVGLMIAGFVLGGIILLKNDFHHWQEFVSVALLNVLIMGGTLLCMRFDVIPESFTTLFLLLVLVILFFAYIGSIAFFRRRRILRQSQHRKTSPPPSLWRVMLGVTASSYSIILAGVFVAYMLGLRLGHSPLTGRAAEVVFFVALIGLRYVIRRVSGFIPPFRYFKSFVLVWILLWCHFAWFHYYLYSTGKATTYLSNLDRGNPTWLAYVDQNVKDARYRNQDLLFIQAVVHQLGEDQEFARQVYQDVKDPRALNNLGVMVLEKKPDDAQSYFEQALKYDPDFSPALYNLGQKIGDRNLIKRAQAIEPWRVNAYQKYAPDKPWIAIFTMREWYHALYWSQGGFWVRGFTEIPLSFREAVRAIREDLDY